MQDLTAAAKAAEQAEAARLAAEREAAQRAQQQALKDALKSVRMQGARIDAIIDRLADLCVDFDAAVNATYMRSPDGGTVLQIEHAKAYLLDIIRYRLRGSLRDGGPLELSPERNPAGETGQSSARGQRMSVLFYAPPVTVLLLSCMVADVLRLLT